MQNNFDELDDELGIYAEESTGSFMNVPVGGPYVARCYGVIQLGSQANKFNEGKLQKKIVLKWELPFELYTFNEDKGPQPFSVEHTYTLSLSPKSTLGQHIASWWGPVAEEDKPFSVSKLLGKPCQISMVEATDENGKAMPGKSKIGAITGLGKGMTCPPQINKTVTLSFKRWNQEVFDKLPEFRRKQIESSPEYQDMLQTAE